jgi:hypothetical protein
MTHESPSFKGMSIQTSPVSREVALHLNRLKISLDVSQTQFVFRESKEHRLFPGKTFQDWSNIPSVSKWYGESDDPEFKASVQIVKNLRFPKKEPWMEITDGGGGYVDIRLNELRMKR